MRLVPLTLVLLAAGCATVPHAWQNPETGALASAEEMTDCRIEADREAQRTALLYGWGGFGYYPGAWRRGFVAPGWGWGLGSASLATAQRAQELTAFCLRVKGYRWLPIQPTTAPPSDTRDATPAEGKPAEEKPSP